MSDNNRIPKDPKKNLARMKSILDRWEVKLKRKQEIAARTQERLVGTEDQIRADIVAREAGKEVDEEQAEIRKTLARKYVFELDGDPTADPPHIGLLQEISQLKSKVIWCKRQQIPFIKSEITRVYGELDGTVDTAKAEVMADVAEEDLDGTADPLTMEASG